MIDWRIELSKRYIISGVGLRHSLIDYVVKIGEGNQQAESSPLRWLSLFMEEQQARLAGCCQSW